MRKKPDNRRYTQALPRELIMKLEIAAAVESEKTGIRVNRTDLVKRAVAEFVERHGL